MAVVKQLDRRWNLHGLSSLTYEAIDDLPMLVVVLRRPLTYAEAIDVDAWVRDGGRALVLAEPGVSWAGPTDTVNPLLRDATWGLRLAARDDEVLALPGGGALALHNAGRWTASAGCNVRLDGLLAECRPGKGRALLVADTGLLDRKPLDLTGGDFDNATGLVGALAEALANGKPVPATFATGGGEYARGQPSMTLMLVISGLSTIALGALAVWAILIGVARTPVRAVATGPARIVRDRPDDMGTAFK
jgi:hypothetical protein